MFICPSGGRRATEWRRVECRHSARHKESGFLLGVPFREGDGRRGARFDAGGGAEITQLAGGMIECFLTGVVIHRRLRMSRLVAVMQQGPRCRDAEHRQQQEPSAIFPQPIHESVILDSKIRGCPAKMQQGCK